jgi:hypothetical protein
MQLPVVQPEPCCKSCVTYLDALIGEGVSNHTSVEAVWDNEGVSVSNVVLNKRQLILQGLRGSRLCFHVYRRPTRRNVVTHDACMYSSG